MRIKKNGKTINLTENDLKKIVKKQKTPTKSKKSTPKKIEEGVMKIKKGGDTFNLTESDIKKLNVFLLTEQRAGIIQQGDTDFCLIVCDVKHAKYGSNGEMVKKIQHLLAANGFNEEFVGGGMESGCDREWPTCDGKFRRHTKDAVVEFQKKYNLKADGIVGPLTLKKMCEVLKSTHSLMKKPLCPDCKCDDPPKDTDKDPPKDTDKDPDIDIDDPNIGDKECATIIGCIKKIMSGDISKGKEWITFLECIGKLKNIIFPPIDMPKTGWKRCSCVKNLKTGFDNNNSPIFTDGKNDKAIWENCRYIDTVTNRMGYAKCEQGAIYYIEDKKRGTGVGKDV